MVDIANIFDRMARGKTIMQKRYPLFAIALLGVCQKIAADETIADCVMATEAFNQMQEASLHSLGLETPSEPLIVKVADDVRERTAGYQHICPATIERTMILFKFDRDMQTSFHMHNCHAPLDIAFIDADGVVIDIKRMEPYVNSMLFIRQPRYQSRAPFRYALETAAGRLQRLGIKVGVRLALP
jgi:uncharacterized membrane protein (UPF0127 family)